MRPVLLHLVAEKNAAPTYDQEYEVRIVLPERIIMECLGLLDLAALTTIVQALWPATQDDDNDTDNKDTTEEAVYVSFPVDTFPTTTAYLDIALAGFTGCQFVSLRCTPSGQSCALPFEPHVSAATARTHRSVFGFTNIVSAVSSGEDATNPSECRIAELWQLVTKAVGDRLRPGDPLLSFSLWSILQRWKGVWIKYTDDDLRFRSQFPRTNGWNIVDCRREQRALSVGALTAIRVGSVGTYTGQYSPDQFGALLSCMMPDRLLPAYRLVVLVIASRGDVYDAFARGWVMQAGALRLLGGKVLLLYNEPPPAWMPSELVLHLSAIDKAFIPGIMRNTLVGLHAVVASCTFDYLLRTNLSSFWHFGRLLRQLEAGNITMGRGCAASPLLNINVNSPSGAGYIIRPAVARLILSNWRELWNSTVPDDVAVGRIFKNVGLVVTPLLRVDLVSVYNWRDLVNNFLVASQACHVRLAYKQMRNNEEIKMAIKILVSAVYGP